MVCEKCGDEMSFVEQEPGHGIWQCKDCGHQVEGEPTDGLT